MADTQAPVTISIVGTGTGDGGGVAPTPDKTLAHTPAGQPNLIVNVVPPLIAILVRAVTLFLTSLVGLLSTAGIGVEIFSATDFAGIVRASAWAALMVAGMGTLKNLITVFSRVEGRYPLLSGSI